MEDNLTKKDLMDRTEVVNNIEFIVDNLPKDDHTCISINGEWGSGKTFVMEMLEKYFTSNDNYLVVKYDAWENSYYSDPLIAILYSIVDKLNDERKPLDRTMKNLINNALDESKSTWRKHRRDLFKQMLNTGYNSKNFWIAVGCCVAEKIYNIIKKTKLSLLDNELFKEYQSYQTLLYEIKDLLSRLTISDNRKNQRRIIVLVDEIDRCLPDQQLVILEKLHHLFDIENCAVIVAMNKNSIIDSYNNMFKTNKNYGKEYLRKFFQHEIYLDDKELVYLQNWLTDYINEQIIPDKGVGNVCAYDIVTYVGKMIDNSFKEKSVIYTDMNFYYNEFDETIKIDAREIKTYINKLNYILESLNKESISYEHIWFTSVMLFYKIYAPRKFGYFLSGAIELYAAVPYFSLYDFYQEKDIDYIHSEDYYVTAKKYKYYTYKEYKDNVYQYILNYCLMRNIYDNLINRLKNFSNMKNIDVSWIDETIKLVDKYGM